VFPRFSGERELAPALWYWANNVAVRKSFFESLPLPANLPLYRGQNVVHANLLRDSQHTVWRQPRARAIHQLPALSELVSRYVVFGSDTVTLARLVGDPSGRFYRRGSESNHRPIGRAGHFVQRAQSVLQEDRRRLWYLPFALPMVVVCVGSYLVGMAKASLQTRQRQAVTVASGALE
jgi:hypothetical protein